MNYPTVSEGSTPVVFQDVPEMEGLDFCLMYFDDPSVMFMAPSIRKRVDEGEKFEAKYYILSYKREDKPIEEVVKEIKDEIELLPGKKLVIQQKHRLPTPESVARVAVSPLFGKKM